MSNAWTITVFKLILALHCQLFVAVEANLWTSLQRNHDLRYWRQALAENSVARFYLDDIQARITVFALIDDVFVRNDTEFYMETEEDILSYFFDGQDRQIGGGKRWQDLLVLKQTVRNEKAYLTQWENAPNNYSYFINNGRLCNHVLPLWSEVSGNQWLYKICSPIGQIAYPGSALSLIEETTIGAFDKKRYDNHELQLLKTATREFPLEANMLYGDSAFGHLHTFFLPNNDAYRKITDRQYQITKESVMAHVTMPGMVIFTEAWLYDYKVHKYPTVTVDAMGRITPNNEIKIWLRNITSKRTGRWQLYAVSDLYRRPFITFQSGSVWAKIVTPNIPVSNGVVHVIDSVLSVVSSTIDQILASDIRFKTLYEYINIVGQIVKKFFATQSGLVTFFAPLDEAFDAIPDQVEQRLLKDHIWLEQIIRLHIVPNVQLLSAEITNHTTALTADNLRQLYFIKSDWPPNSENIVFYVVGGGTKAAIVQEDVAAMNGIIHYIDHVLGVPYATIYKVTAADPALRTSFKWIEDSNLGYTMDPWEVTRPEQNFTFFAPTNRAWQRHAGFRRSFQDPNYYRTFQHALRRHIVQGQALRLQDLRERAFVMMNDEKVILRRRAGSTSDSRVGGFELFWPREKLVAQLEDGGELACTNGFIHKIDNVFLAQDEHIQSQACRISISNIIPLMSFFILLRNFCTIFGDFLL